MLKMYENTKHERRNSIKRSKIYIEKKGGGTKNLTEGNKTSRYIGKYKKCSKFE